ncbi:MAG: hypothetical protein IH901_08630 [Proteobacteria bacterium]|nr:hypothetical protein [Pseudomonadota bacterium]
MQFGAPAPTVIPGVPAYGTPVIPGDSQTLRSPFGSAHSSQSDAPPYDPIRDGVPKPLNDNPVPHPDHLDPENGEKISPAGSESESPFGNTDASTVPTPEGPRLASLEFESSNRSDNGFVTPIPVTVDSGNIVTAGGETEQLNPYDYDRKNYQWLRGKIDFDEQDQTWHIIYSLTPDQKDRFGGSITLIDHPDLNKFQNDDVAYLEGRVDSGSLDRSGKAKYRIDKLFGPLVHQSQLSTTAGN